MYQIGTKIFIIYLLRQWSPVIQRQISEPCCWLKVVWCCACSAPTVNTDILRISWKLLFFQGLPPTQCWTLKSFLRYFFAIFKSIIRSCILLQDEKYIVLVKSPFQDRFINKCAAKKTLKSCRSVVPKFLVRYRRTYVLNNKEIKYELFTLKLCAEMN